MLLGLHTDPKLYSCYLLMVGWLVRTSGISSFHMEKRINLQVFPPQFWTINPTYMILQDSRHGVGTWFELNRHRNALHHRFRWWDLSEAAVNANCSMFFCTCSFRKVSTAMVLRHLAQTSIQLFSFGRFCWWGNSTRTFLGSLRSEFCEKNTRLVSFRIYLLDGLGCLKCWF